MAQVDYGLKKIRLMPAKSDGTFPAFGSATEFLDVQFIVTDSFQEDKDDDQTTDISVEELDDPILRLPGERGLKTLTFQSNNLDTPQYEYLFGYIVDGAGWTVETPDFVLPPQAIQITTKPIDKYPASVHEYAKADVKVKRTGTTGKSGLPNIQFDITFPANLDIDGKSQPNHRFKTI